MTTTRRYGRPDRASLLAMMTVNAVGAIIVLTVALTLFGVRELLPFNLAAMLHIVSAPKWSMVWPMLPGAAIAYGCLWYWEVIIGRSRGVPWGGAAVYGLVIALIDVPIAGLLYGLTIGMPGLCMLFLFALLIILPGWLLTVAAFGISMGLLNGYLAQCWIDRHRVRP